MDDIDVSRTQKKKHALKVTNFAKQLSRLSIKQISKLFDRISFLNFAEPVTFVLSPILINVGLELIFIN